MAPPRLSALLIATLICAIFSVALAEDPLYPVDGKVRLALLNAEGVVINEVPPILERLQYTTMKLMADFCCIPLFYKSIHSASCLTVPCSLAPPGSYTLEVHSQDYKFPVLRVDVSRRDEGKIRAKNLHTNQPSRVPLVITPALSVQYFEEEKSLNIVKMITNNYMFWMFGAIMLMSQIFPYLVDAEEMKGLRGTEVATQPEELLKSFKIPKSDKQIAEELKLLSGPNGAQEALRLRKELGHDGEDDGDEESSSDEK